MKFNIWKYRVELAFLWFDFWIGFYWDQAKRKLYVCPLPMIVIAIDRRPVPIRTIDRIKRTQRLEMAGSSADVFDILANLTPAEINEIQRSTFDRVREFQREQDIRIWNGGRQSGRSCYAKDDEN
jgi:hypothetical protein